MKIEKYFYIFSIAQSASLLLHKVAEKFRQNLERDGLKSNI